MAKEVERNLESTMVEVAEDKENIFSLPCPLPPSTYKAADRNSETKHPAGNVAPAPAPAPAPALTPAPAPAPAPAQATSTGTSPRLTGRW